uniref:Protein SDA1 n=1 Tax=Aceria tosichella TaxID=561515 RepID=A0A6G1SFI7_9ACAR
MHPKGNNRFPLNLPHLQNCIKKDPTAYQEEFQVQYRHYESILQILMMNPAYFDKQFESLVTFLAHTVPCYKDRVEFPEQLINLLRNYSTGLHRDSRLACCKALMILRSRNFVPLTSLLPLFFELSKCQDKSLRSYIRQNIVSDIRALNKKSRNEKVNKELQKFMYDKLSNEQQIVEAKLALDIMIELYKKSVWQSRDLVNQIAFACQSRTSKILVTALQFFLGTDEEAGEDEDDKDDEDSKVEKLNQLKETLKANKFNKSTRKREKILAKVKKTVNSIDKKEKNENINFSALHLINDPQTLAEKLLSGVQSTTEKFEVKLMMMSLISRLIGAHELLVLNFYSYIAKYLQPHQTDVTRILQYAAQATHKLVPPEDLEHVVKAITYNFVTDRSSSEAITVGLNAIREICARNSEVMDEDLLQDLTQYQKYKNKNVSSAAKSLIHLYRIKNPNLLSRKDRGRPLDDSLKRTHSVMSLEDDEMNFETEEEDEDSYMELETDDDQSIQDDEFGEWEEAEGDGEEEDEGDAEEEEDEDAEGEDENEKLLNPSDKVRLEDIERLYKRPRHDKESRLATVIEGRQGRGKYGQKKPKLNEKSSTSNRDKRRNKAFGMIKHKLKRHKKTKTFHEKQLELKQKLIRQERAKR